MSVYRPKNYRSHVIKLTIGGREMKFPGVADDAASRQIERQIKRLAAIRAARDPIPYDLADWVHQLPQHLPDLDRKLREHGILDPGTGSGRRPLLELLYGVIETTEQFEEMVKKHNRNGNSEEDARRKAMALYPTLYKTKKVGWFQHLLSEDNTPEYVLLRVARARIVLEGCDFLYFDDFDANKTGVWLKRQRVSCADFGATTSNHHLKAIKSFAEWARAALKRNHERSPLEKMKPINEATDVRRRRRAPAADEVRKLLVATRGGPTLFGLTPRDRQMLYRFVMVMGLRASECASLTPESFAWGADGQDVKVQACYSKHRREDVLPVPNFLARWLRRFLRHKATGQPLWPGRWADEAADMLRKDLDRAGIAYKTADGYFDFHATRHGALTNGSAVMTLMQLKNFARHGKIEMTLRYTHTNKDELTDAVRQLPKLGNDPLRARKRRMLQIQSDQKSDQSVVPSRDLMSAVVRRVADATKNTSPDTVRACVPVVTGLAQRGRRGSNPQPPDRQSGTLTN